MWFPARRTSFYWTSVHGGWQCEWEGGEGKTNKEERERKEKAGRALWATKVGIQRVPSATVWSRGVWRLVSHCSGVHGMSVTLATSSS